MNYSLGAAGASDFSDEGKKSKKLKNKKKKNKDRERSRSMEPISPPPTKKRRSEKNDRTSPGSLSPVSEEDTYTGLQTKPKKVRCLSKLGASLEIYKSFLVEYIFNVEPIALFSLKRQAKNKNRSKTRLRNQKTLIEFPLRHPLLQIHLQEDIAKNHQLEEPRRRRKENYQKMN